jgi:hypothetical protein
MSSTITAGKAVYAIDLGSDGVGYLLMESVYDSRTFPRNPEWVLIYAGKLEGVIETMFHMASHCLSGSIQGKNGRITPQGYIREWFSKLAEPMGFPAEGLKLKVPQHFWTSGHDQTEEGKKVLGGLSQTMIDEMKSDGYTFPVGHQVFELIVFLFKTLGVGARFLDLSTRNWTTRTHKSLGYSPAKKKYGGGFEIPEFFRISEKSDRLFEKQADGSFRNKGYSFWVESTLVRDYWKFEMKYPGSYPSMFKIIHQACSGRPLLPQGKSKAVISMAATKDPNALATIRSLLKILGEKDGVESGEYWLHVLDKTTPDGINPLDIVSKMEGVAWKIEDPEIEIMAETLPQGAWAW